MNMGKMGRPDRRAQARVLKALAHPTRLHFVERLAGGPLCVCELAKGISADLSTISRHLSLLKSAGIVADERRGTKVFYELRTPCVLQFLECVSTVLQENARAHANAAGLPARAPAN
jgi:ArsR family transcriptional regulator